MRRQARLWLRALQDAQDEAMLERMRSASPAQPGIDADFHVPPRWVRIAFGPIGGMLTNYLAVVLLGLILWRLW